MNLANKLTILRLFLIPFILLFIYLEDFRLLALTLFSIAVITDYFDGWIATRKNMRSRFGNFIDPVSDKILIISCLTLLSFLNIFPLWMVFIVIAREFMMNGLRSALSDEKTVVGANKGGKLKFSFQSLLVFLSIVYLTFNRSQMFLLFLNILFIFVWISLFNLFLRGFLSPREVESLFQA